MTEEARHLSLHLRDKIRRSKQQHQFATSRHMSAWKSVQARKHSQYCIIQSYSDRRILTFLTRIFTSSQPILAMDISPLFNDCSRSDLFTRQQSSHHQIPNQKAIKKIVAQFPSWRLDSLSHSKRHLPRIRSKVLLDPKNSSLAGRKISTRLQKSEALGDNRLRLIQNICLYGTRIPSMSAQVFIFALGFALGATY